MLKVLRILEVKNWTKGSSTYRKNAINVAASIDTFTELNAPTTKALVKVVNILGQEVSLDEVSFVRSIFFNIYDDGSVEKVVKVSCNTLLKKRRC